MHQRPPTSYDVMLKGLGIFIGGVFALAGLHPFYVIAGGVIVVLLGVIWSIATTPRTTETVK